MRTRLPLCLGPLDKGLPVHPHLRPCLPLQNSSRALPSPGPQMGRRQSQWQGASVAVQGQRRQHKCVGPHSGPGRRAISSFRTVKCLAKVKCSQEVCSHTERQGPGSEANSWPFPKDPAPFPVHCSRWRYAWVAQHLSRTGKDEVSLEEQVGTLQSNPLVPDREWRLREGSGLAQDHTAKTGPVIPRLMLSGRCLEIWPLHSLARDPPTQEMMGWSRWPWWLERMAVTLAPVPPLTLLPGSQAMPGRKVFPQGPEWRPTVPAKHWSFLGLSVWSWGHLRGLKWIRAP